MKTKIVFGLITAAIIVACSTTPLPPIAVSSPTIQHQSPVEQMIKSVPLVFYDGGVGGGVLFKVGDKIGMITAAHVIGDHNATPTTPETYGTKPIGIVGFAIGTETVQYGSIAKLLAIDPLHDWAVLSIDSPHDDMRFSEFSSSLPAIGESVWAVGSPMGESGDITHGIVCHPWRMKPISATETAPFIHTDAAGTFGSSGGGLFNDKGVCVGIVLRKHPLNDTMYAISTYLIQEQICSLLLGVEPMPPFVP